MPDRRFATDGMVGVSGACAVLSDGVSSNQGVGGKISSRDVDGGGGVSSNYGGGGMIGSPVDMFDSSRDGGTCIGGDGTCCGLFAGVSCSVGIHGVSGSSLTHGGASSSWGSGMGASSVDDVGSGVSGCVSRGGETGGWAGGVSWMTHIGVGQGGVALGTFFGDTTGKTGCGAGCSKASERQRTRGLRTGAYTEFGNIGISDVSGSPAMASGIDSSATGVGVIGTSADVDGPSYHETHQADRDQCMSAHLCHEGNRRDHATDVVLPLPHVERDFQQPPQQHCDDRTFVPNDNPWAQPTH